MAAFKPARNVQFGLLDGTGFSCLLIRSTLKKGRVSELNVLKYLSQLLHNVRSGLGNMSTAGNWLNKKNFFGMLDSLDVPTVSIYDVIDDISPSFLGTEGWLGSVDFFTIPASSNKTCKFFTWVRYPF